jgi:hypothetical protein
MPKEAVNITSYEGVHGVVDSADLAPGMAYYAENIDMVNRLGHFVGLNRDLAYSLLSGSIDGPSCALGDGAQRVVVYNNATLYLETYTESDAAGSVSQTYVAPSGLSVSCTCDATTGATLAPMGDAVYVGRGPNASYPPMWVGYLYFNQWDTTPETTGTLTHASAVIHSEGIGWSKYRSDTQNNFKAHLPDVIVTTDFVGTESVFTLAEMADNNLEFDNDQVIFPIGSKVRYYSATVYEHNQIGPAAAICEVDISRTDILCTQWKEFTPGQTTGGNAPNPVNWTPLPAKSLVLRHDGNDDGTLTTAVCAVPTVSAASVKAAWMVANGALPVALVRPNKPATGLKALELELQVRITPGASTRQGLNARATALRIYRSISYKQEDGTYPESEPVFIKEISFSEVRPDGTTLAWGTAVTGANAAYDDFDLAGDTYRRYSPSATTSFVDDNPGSTTYSADTGVSHKLQNMQVHYGLSCMANAYHVVGRTWVNGLFETKNWIFRSKPFQPSVFDVDMDFLNLGRTPLALVYYANRVFAFCAGYTYVINPELFVIEDEWEGIGAINRESIATGERGMFWADDANIYHFDGNRLNIIGGPVLRLTRPVPDPQVTGGNWNVGWLNRTKTLATSAVYSARYDAFFLFYAVPKLASGIEGRGLMYHVPSERWSPVTQFGAHTNSPSTNSASTVVRSFTNSRGEVLYANSLTGAKQASGLQLMRLFGYEPDSTYGRRPWRFVSRQIQDQGLVSHYYAVRMYMPEIDHTIGGANTAEPPVMTIFINSPGYNSYRTPATGVQVSDRVWEWSLKNDQGQLTGWADAYSFAFALSSTGPRSASGLAIIRRTKTPR